MSLEKRIRTWNRQAHSRKVGHEAHMQLNEESVLDTEEDIGTSRLLLLQAALKERRIIETKG